MPSPTSISLNGPFAAATDGRGVSFASRGAARLLAYLALNGPTDRGRVALALWPSVDRERALMSLRQALRAVVLAGGEGWVVAGRATLRLHERVAIGRGDGPLLEGWDEPWIDAHRPRRTGAPPTDALFELLAWYGERDPNAALRLASDAFTTVGAAPSSRIVRELAPIVGQIERLTRGTEDVANLVARSHYLLGRMQEAHDLYGRLVNELDPAVSAGWIANAGLAQVVLLRESGAAREAARRAAIVVENHPKTDHFDWSPRYHLGLALHLAGDPEGLRMARRAVERDVADADALTRLFPILNVAEALIDAGSPDAGDFLDEAGRIAVLTDDLLGGLTVEMLEALMLAREAPDETFERLRALERRAWEARLVPFAANLADRAALLAHRIGRMDEARRLLQRGDRARKRLGLRRVPIERVRLAPLRALVPL